MAQLLNKAVTKRVVEQVPVGLNYSIGSTIFVQASTPQNENIILWGKLYLYRQFSNSDFTQYFTAGQWELRQDREGLRVGFPLVATDLLRLIPLYDFPLMRIWVNNATY